MSKINKDILTSLILTLVSVIILWETKGLTKISYIFPRTIGVILLIFSLMYLISSFLKPKSNHTTENKGIKNTLMMSVSMIGYFILMVIFGFLTSSLIYMGFVSWYLQKDFTNKNNTTKITHSILSSIIVSITFFLLFRIVFSVPLPEGLFI